MTQARLALAQGYAWPGWCCPHCSAPLQALDHGLSCTAEPRWFATQAGVHRLLPAERRQELQPFVELYQRIRRDEGWRAQRGLPDVEPSHPHAHIWQRRARHFRDGIELAAARIGSRRWDVLEVGAGCCWASVRLMQAGHRAVAVDLNLDPDDGLAAAEKLLGAAQELPRAEADMEALPLAAGAFDLVLAAGSLHYTAALTRVLVELRRVTRRGGVLLILDSPVYRMREDGEAMVAARMRDHARRYRVGVPREFQSSYLVLGELGEVFSRAGWLLEVHAWPSRARELARDTLEIARHRRRTARFPILLARRDV